MGIRIFLLAAKAVQICERTCKLILCAGVSARVIRYLFVGCFVSFVIGRFCLIDGLVFGFVRVMIFMAVTLAMTMMVNVAVMVMMII